ncbi:SHD1 domain-containing protein [Pontiellaceae bacterium B1224]|nr:SHD1 domain-containing protein [Pontiellaceae bacterium B1224]
MKTTQHMVALAALAATFVYSTALAETRIWTDTTGKTIEAEQVKLLSNQVLLRLADGREVKVSLDTLCEEDRKQAMLDQPPTLELKVSAKTNRSNTSRGDLGRRSRIQVEEESTQVVVAVAKTSSAPYELPLNAVLYVMGEWGGDQLEVIDKVTSTLSYTEKNQVFDLASEKFESRKLAGGERRTEYKGWVVVIFDSNGDRIALKSSSKAYEKNLKALLASEKGAELDSNFEPTTSTNSAAAARNPRF